MQTRGFSHYLDLLRLLAASAVVLYHLKTNEIGPESLRRLLPGFGHEFVVVFFVLSGYVIAWSVDRRQGTLLDYALDRAARIYSVVLPTLVLSTLAAAALGLGTAADLFSSLATNLVFVGQSWGLNDIPPSNPAFWSMCYEVMYYALFGCVFYLRGTTRLVASFAVIAIAGPKVLLLLPCWLAGVAAYRARDALGRAALPVSLGAIVVLGAMSALKIGAHLNHFDAGGVLGHSSHFLKDYVTAVLVAMHLYAIRQVDFRMPGWLTTSAGKGAALTFTLYLIHYPVILATKAAFGAASGSAFCFGVTLLLVVAATYAVGVVTESRRHRLRELLARLPTTIGAIMRTRTLR